MSRCSRGADIARRLGFSEPVCAGIYSLDEHWDGSGRPDALSGDAIPLFARIALLSQVVDVFHAHAGRAAAVAEAQRRQGTWFDPALVAVFERVAVDDHFWSYLKSPLLEARVVQMAPISHSRSVDEDYLDSIALAFGQVIDAKSPYTAGHSGRVADLADRIAAQMDVPQARRRWLRRAAFLHDIGKLGVSNAILDKPGGLDDREWESMRLHSSHTREILGKIGAFVDLADVAAAHHERLDGRGYPLGLDTSQIRRETRIVTVCDFYDALTSDRPYRESLDVQEALAIMEREVGQAIDGDCFEALRSSVLRR